MDRLRTEQQFHDRQAEQRATTYAASPEKLVFKDEQYLQHESWIAPAVVHLGDVSGKRLLDYGCGHGMAAVVFARRGAHVTAFDLSHGYVREAAARAAANNVHVDLLQADAQRLPFADASFDLIWGNAILHHLDVTIAARELFRVLRPGGIVVLCEPWGGNPLLRWAREQMAYGSKDRTPDETPLRQSEIAILRKIFPRVELRGFQLLSMIRRLCPWPPVVRALERCDRLLLSRLPGLQRLCRYTLITLTRE